MKFIIMGLFFWSASVQAQSVQSVRQDQVTISTGETKVDVGDEVVFFNAQLDEAGRGLVTKVTPQGKRALVLLSAGTAKAGMSFEKSAPRKKNLTPRRAELNLTAYDRLTPEEREILARGEISTARYVVGGIVGTYPIGFGVGHAIQGRYSEIGWIFTVGELASAVVFVAGLGDCLDDSWNNDGWDGDGCNGGLMLAGAMGFVGFRIWEIIDVWAAPPGINQRYRSIRARLNEDDQVQIDPIVIPQADGGRLGLRFRF